jgi:hypothetical protein
MPFAVYRVLFGSVREPAGRSHAQPAASRSSLSPASHPLLLAGCDSSRRHPLRRQLFNVVRRITVLAFRRATTRADAACSACTSRTAVKCSRRTCRRWLRAEWTAALRRQAAPSDASNHWARSFLSLRSHLLTLVEATAADSCLLAAEEAAHRPSGAGGCVRFGWQPLAGSGSVGGDSCCLRR